jgi:hypothetical protein
MMQFRWTFIEGLAGLPSNSHLPALASTIWFSIKPHFQPSLNMSGTASDEQLRGQGSRIQNKDEMAEGLGGTTVRQVLN